MYLFWPWHFDIAILKQSMVWRPPVTCNTSLAGIDSGKIYPQANDIDGIKA